MKKLTPYLLVFLGAIIMILGATGSLPVIIDSILLRMGLKNEMEVSTMGFLPFAVPVSSRSDHLNAPDVEITRAPSGAMATLFPTPTPSNLAPYSGMQEVSPTSTPKPTPFPTIPNRLEIESIKLDAPIISANPSEIRIGSDIYEQWKAPDEFAVGWHTTSAMLGEVGNTVLNGHHNINGRVFEDLNQVKPGQQVVLYGGNLKYTYIVVNVMILPERNVDMSVRSENARWILPSNDERITLITCWPAESNTHRLIVVAQPFSEPVEISPTDAPAGAE